MTVSQTIKMSLTSMYSNKVRTALTVLGIVIGIAAVIVVFSAGEGIRSLIVGQVESFGTDIIQAEMKVPSTKKGSAGDAESGRAMAQGVQVTTLKIEDMEKINRISNIKNSYAIIQGQGLASYGNELRKEMFWGVSASFIDIDKGEIENGRFFTEEEDKTLAPVIVLGKKAKENLFGETNPLGKSIKFQKDKYRVIGVMKERGSAGPLNLDNMVYMPVKTAQKRILGIDHLHAIISQVENTNLSDETAEEMKIVLRQNHEITDPDKDDFRVTTMAEMLSILSTVTGAITLLLLAIVAISLIVGGVGIMNIMYVVVTERTSEIGLRKAVGASYRDIMLQFLIEAILITLVGGIIGIIIGIAISAGLAAVANNYLNGSWKFIIPMRAFVVSISFSVIFGLLFGVYPARKAAKLDPIEALRSE